MSVTAAKKKSAAPATTGRGAALFIALGIALITLGIAWLFSLFLLNTGSTILTQLRQALVKLCGTFCYMLPVLMIWGGVMLLVSTRHRVSLRNFVLVFSLFIMVLALTPLIGISADHSPYMDYVASQNTKKSIYDPTGYSAYLYHELEENNKAGGLIGMLIAYPLWKLFTQIGATLLVAFIIIVLLFVLFRFNPGEVLRRASDSREKRRAGKAAEQGASARPAAAYQETPAPQVPSAPQVPDLYDYNAPIYDPNPAGAPIPMQDPADGFYPVQPDLYEEPPVQQTQVQYARQPGNTAYEQTVRQDRPSFLDRIRSAMGSDQGKQTPIPAPVQETKRPAAVTEKPAARKPAPQNAAEVLRPAAPITPVVPAKQALDEIDDELPWDETEVRPARPARKPVENKAGQIPAETIREIARHAAAPVPTPAPVASSWADQVKEKKREAESKLLPEHTTAAGAPKPVYTDPVMPITDEKIPIKPAESKRPLQDAKLDGTSAPKVKQGSMGLNVPYQAPPIRLLKEAQHVPQSDAGQEDERRAQVIETTLSSFGVDSEVKQIMHGPAITRFAIQIAPGVKVSRVSNTADNLALELKTRHVRVEAPIQGTNYIGIEVPNQVVSPVFLREVLDSPEMQNNPSPLVVALGKDIAGSPVLCDLSKMPHLLIAGATGSGKSVCINSIVCSLLYRTSPDQVRLIMVDPKQVELSVYNGIPHLLVPVVSDPRKAAGALSWVVQEMLERYGKFSAQNVRNLAGYNKVNQGTDQVLPNIVVIIDEMADLMEVCRKDVEESIRRLAALARAAGIYMVLATQRPSVDVITGVIKNNIPSRIAFAVSSGTDSRTIIDINGAEKLMGKGDMLYKPTGTSPIRVQGCFVSDEEVNAITDYIASRYQANYDPNIADHLENVGKENAADEIGGIDDAPGGGGDGSFTDLLRQAIEMAVEDGQTSTSMLQRRLRVGYARAGRLIDEMEKRGVISHSEGSKPRKTLITREEYYEMYSGEQ